jgi:integrase
MPTFMAELRLQAGIAAEALQFLIYTAARTGEVIGAIDNETNCKTRVWTVPGERMKAGKDHRVALSDPALKILASRQWSGGVIFRAGPYKGALSNAAMAAVLARMGRSDITVHGMRSSFRTWVRETRPEDREAAELALAHVVGDDTERAYARGDLLERRKILMGAWAEYCLSADQQAEVIPIRI